MTNQDTIEIRILGLEDGAALGRLAQIDTAAPPHLPRCSAGSSMGAWWRLIR